MLKAKLRLTFLICFVAVGCISAQEGDKNPPAPGFNAEDSDAKAIEIADQVMQTMGGRKNWDDARYLTWKFFGRRFHVWDKQTGNIRVESDGRVVLMNINTRQGRTWENGEEVTNADSLAKYLDGGYRAWVNDAYWMFMPYKLKDSGVTLKYMGEGKTANGADAEMLQMTFEGVGVTPQNKYDVYVNKETGLVEQWSYYPNAADAEPRFTGAWQDWKHYGKIMLSGSRGERGHSDIAVFDELPASVFENPEPVDIMSFQQAASK